MQENEFLYGRIQTNVTCFKHVFNIKLINLTMSYQTDEDDLTAE